MGILFLLLEGIKEGERGYLYIETDPTLPRCQEKKHIELERNKHDEGGEMTSLSKSILEPPRRINIIKKSNGDECGE